MSGRSPEGAPRGQRPFPTRAWRGRRRQGTGGDASLREALLALLESMGGSPERAGLQSLWDNWETVIGPELAALAQPLGHHAAEKGPGAPGRVTLLLGADDAMLLQELRFRADEILERVNGFLGHAYFCEVKVSLPLGRRAPTRSRRPSASPGATEGDEMPAARGTFLAGMDRDSPVARCYARFARLVTAAGGRAGGEAEESKVE